MSLVPPSLPRGTSPGTTPGTTLSPAASTAPRSGLLTQRLLALAFAGWVLLNFPLLKLALSHAPAAALLGLPRLPVLLFGAWAGLIVLLAWLMERNSGAADDAPRAQPDAAPRGR